MKRLSELTVRAGEQRTFVLHLEDDEGRGVDVAVTPEQLSLIADELDQVLEREDRTIPVYSEEIYQKPLG